MQPEHPETSCAMGWGGYFREKTCNISETGHGRINTICGQINYFAM